MKKRKRFVLVAIATITIGVLGGVIFGWRYSGSRTAKHPSFPPEENNLAASATIQPAQNTKVALTPASPKPTTTTNSAATTLPAAINITVPFTTQAPFGNWADPYSEFCEEASVLMAMSYVNHESIPNADAAKAKLFAIKTFEEARFGYYKDTTATETAAIIQELYKYGQVRLLNNPTAADIKKALAAGKLVLVPAAGRMLGNPHFQTPGPLYHMLVIKGYTEDGKFITNDPGTKHGADFLYGQDILIKAIHDWHGDSHIEEGKRIGIIVG